MKKNAEKLNFITFPQKSTLHANKGTTLLFSPIHPQQEHPNHIHFQIHTACTRAHIHSTPKMKAVGKKGWLGDDTAEDREGLITERDAPHQWRMSTSSSSSSSRSRAVPEEAGRQADAAEDAAAVAPLSMSTCSFTKRPLFRSFSIWRCALRS